ncbi:MAG: hypothetical protein DRM97_08640 [Thermoprotei archaeon]|nr:MAG: hypothetical protein DRM97_08640 [Thermoprotei archaeon]
MCAMCRRNVAKYILPTGEALCDRCLIRRVMSRVRRAISRYRMFKPTDRIMLCVNGSLESLVMLDVMYSLEREYPTASLVACLVDEGRFEEEHLKEIRRKVEEYGIELIEDSFKERYGMDITSLRSIEGADPCELCRSLRMNIILKIAQENEVTRIAVARNMEYECSIAMLRLIRGLEPLPPSLREGFIAKPMLYVSYYEIEAYALIKAMKSLRPSCPLEDKSLIKYLRSELVELDRRHPGSLFSMIRSLEDLGSLEEKVHECIYCGEIGVEKVCSSCRILITRGIIKSGFSDGTLPSSTATHARG